MRMGDMFVVGLSPGPFGPVEQISAFLCVNGGGALILQRVGSPFGAIL